MPIDPGIGLTTITEVDQLTMYGATLSPDLRRCVTDIRFSMRHDAVSEITITLNDGGFKFLADGFFRINDYVGYRQRHFYVAAVETGGYKPGRRGEKITIYCHPRYVQKLKALTGPFTMTNASASEFVAHEATAVGMRSLCQPCEKRTQVAREQPQEGHDPKYDEQPSSWTTFKTLARDEGYVMFEAVGVIFFGRPTWIITQTISFSVSYNLGNVDTDAIAVPVCKISANEIASPTSINVQILNTRGYLAVPGKKFILQGMPFFDGGYMLTGVDYSLVRYDSCTVTAETPQDPEKPEAPEGGTGSAASFVALAQAQLGDRYVFGAEAMVEDPDPDEWDCSELVEWCAARLGVYMPDGSDNQKAWVDAHGKSMTVDDAIRVRGALLGHPGHIAISRGDGTTIEAANSRAGVVNYSAYGRFNWGGLVPGLIYP